MHPRWDWRQVLGSALLLLVPLVLLGMLLAPQVRVPLGRTVATLGADWFGSSATRWRFEVEDAHRVRPGHPVFRADLAGSLEPVAWVRSVSDGAVDLTRAPGADLPDRPWQLVAISVPSGLADMWELAAPPEVAAQLKGQLTTRLERVLREAVLPELESRLPAFVARIDPRQDERTRQVFDTVGGAVLERLRPLAGELANRVLEDIDEHLDLLDRLGVLWNLVRGDEKRLSEKLLPVAEKSVDEWWTERRDAVLTAVGDGLSAKASTLRAWLGDGVLDAAIEELAEPVLQSQGKRLEREAEAAIGEILRLVVNSPDGGFRVRFTAILRSRLLEKDEPLLLLRGGE